MIQAFLTELLTRFNLKSPAFFQVLQTIGIIAGVVTGIPSFLEGQGIVLPEPFEKISSTVVAVASAILWVVAKLPVENPQAPVKQGEPVAKEEALPFTTAKKKTVTKTKRYAS